MMATPEGAAGPLRVGLFNVKYSPNLGDCVLSACLDAVLRLGARAMHERIDPRRQGAVLAAALQGALAQRRQAPRHLALNP